jgi:hypothetical protein
VSINHEAFKASLRRAKQEEQKGFTLAFRNPKGGILWQSNPGPQSSVMLRPEFEVLLGGARGGGKSDALMAWMVRGNFDLPVDHPCHATVLNHPRFTGLILRRNATDLEEFLNRAAPFYAALGGKLGGTPRVFEWKHGPKIYANHLDSADAFEKYKGSSIPRIGIEELTQISDMRAYLKVLSICRTAHPELRPAWSDGVGQVLTTTNPDGPGAAWVKDRFVEVMGSDNKFIPWGKTMVDPAHGLTRVFIPARLKDNPFLGDSYKSALLLQADADPGLVAAWLDGEWGTTTGTYFKNFRPNGPRDGEPAEARHVVPAGSVQLMPWWPRFIGVDWGFRHDAAVYWGCYNPSDGRIYIYREFVTSGMGTDELGAEIARRSLPDLAGLETHMIPMWLSHECFNRTDMGRTKADQIAAGVEKILGPKSVAVAQYGEQADIRSPDGEMRLQVLPSTRLREDVWQYMRGLMRFTPIQPMGEPNLEYAQSLLKEADGFNRYEAYMQAFAKQKPEVLPGLQIFDNCPRLIKQLKDAVHDEKKPEDILEDGKSHSNDCLDAARYLLHGMRQTREKLPKYAFISQRIDGVSDEVKADPFRMSMVARKAEWDYQKQHKPLKPFSLPRHSSWRN